jgi:WD40 repeat protein
VWDLATGKGLRTLDGYDSMVSELAVTELDGRPVIVTGSTDGTVRVRDLATGKGLRSLHGHYNSATTTRSTRWLWPRWMAGR